jgi:molybdate transport system regulatory protein
MQSGRFRRIPVVSPWSPRTAGIGASSSLPPIPAKVASPSRQRPLRLGDGNRSSCPKADLAVEARRWVGRDLKNGSDLSAHAWQSAGMVRVRISIVFESGARIGPGKAKLLESIRDTGSISAAARDMGMSYKRAWVLLDSINQAFTEPVVTAAPGGAGGGGASLTAFGAEVLERYRRIHDRAAAMAADDLAALAPRARPDAGPKI